MAGSLVRAGSTRHALLHARSESGPVCERAGWLEGCGRWRGWASGVSAWKRRNCICACGSSAEMGGSSRGFASRLTLERRGRIAFATLMRSMDMEKGKGLHWCAASCHGQHAMAYIMVVR
jgi:hypothetical protein